jgi:predicted enzyme related to lactoylglutathione lyase
VRIRGYPQGTPCWVELTSPDPAVSAAFYAVLFGWTPERSIFRLGDYAVAGLSRQRPGALPGWLVHIASDNLEATGRLVRAAGGAVLAPPVPVADDGRSALFADPAGGVFAGWQRGRFSGAQVGNEPGTFCWCELRTGDADGARAFYGGVFGWEDRPGELEPFTYEWELNQRTVAGIVLDRIGPLWTVCFMVDDCETAAARSAGVGGRTLALTDVSVGTYARLADPHGAVFSVVSLVPEIMATL